jgi:hypothetical protein
MNMSISNNQLRRITFYTRISTEEQCSYSVEEQLVELGKYVKQNKDYFIQVPVKREAPDSASTCVDAAKAPSYK